ncbi:acetyltransferase [Algoriphagus jejuensis]|uniref:Acetyltransferase n=1 Tax=Algoriphagus jejuensis TaxID=419934 RepID=A0ABP3YL36_9BACT
MNLIIAGANKLGEYLVSNYSQFRLNHTLVGFVDDDPKLQGKTYAGLPVLGRIDAVMEIDKVALVIALTSPSQKIDIVRRLLYHPSLTFPNLFSSKAWVSRDCIFGRGNLILEGSLINFGTQIGNFNTLGENCSIGHESVISDYSYLCESVQVGGYSFLEDSEIIGKGVVISQGVRIGRDTEIGEGSRVETDLPNESHVKNKP